MRVIPRTDIDPDTLAKSRKLGYTPRHEKEMHIFPVL